jgi:hypothetical protein
LYFKAKEADTLNILSIVKALLLVVLLPSALVAAEYRCADKIISVGDTSDSLFMKCGEPDWNQSHAEEIIETIDKDTKRRIIITVDEWTYNLGPDRFMRIFKLRDGKVVDVQSGDYGSVKGQANKSQCSDRIVSVGDSAADVTARCGEPVWKNKREEVIREWLDDDTLRKVSGTVEDWTYNFGPNRFVRIFTFRNGKVIDVRTGGYGN